MPPAPFANRRPNIKSNTRNIELTAETFASNHRLAEALVKTRDFSTIIPILLDALRTGGRQARAEIADLVQQVDARLPGHGQKLAQELGKNGITLQPSPTPAQNEPPRLAGGGKGNTGPKRKSKEHLDARNLFHITTSIGDRGTNNRADVGKLEALMYMAGVYGHDHTGGPTGDYGVRLKEAVKKFQKARALRVDGNVNPGGETIRALAQHLQDMGRRGGTVLAHLTPEEARFLHENTDGGSINPQTGLMELYDVGRKDGLTVDGNATPPPNHGARPSTPWPSASKIWGEKATLFWPT